MIYEKEHNMYLDDRRLKVYDISEGKLWYNSHPSLDMGEICALLSKIKGRIIFSEMFELFESINYIEKCKKIAGDNYFVAD